MIRPGLCDRCANAREVGNRQGSTFVLCEKSKEDPRFRRYPMLPVTQCIGYEPRATHQTKGGE